MFAWMSLYLRTQISRKTEVNISQIVLNDVQFASVFVCIMYLWSTKFFYLVNSIRIMFFVLRHSHYHSNYLKKCTSIIIQAHWCALYSQLLFKIYKMIIDLHYNIFKLLFNQSNTTLY